MRTRKPKQIAVTTSDAGLSVCSINQSRRKGRLHQSEGVVVASSFHRFIIGFRISRCRSYVCSGDNSPHMRRRSSTCWGVKRLGANHGMNGKARRPEINPRRFIVARNYSTKKRAPDFDALQPNNLPSSSAGVPQYSRGCAWHSRLRQRWRPPLLVKPTQIGITSSAATKCLDPRRPSKACLTLSGRLSRVLSSRWVRAKRLTPR